MQAFQSVARDNARGVDLLPGGPVRCHTAPVTTPVPLRHPPPGPPEPDRLGAVLRGTTVAVVAMGASRAVPDAVPRAAFEGARPMTDAEHDARVDAGAAG
ncbi:hypothetical protein JD78_00157 [Modestobacter roseus]|uniref:Uncharacterized protein n=1 Tax=Modestobacter roseus TaxID=1181884 RepID=A0A562IKX0_9ACTN|nr:hypothetical protein JD78_00157 [Modestobacter roseus]